MIRLRELGCYDIVRSLQHDNRIEHNPGCGCENCYQCRRAVKLAEAVDDLVTECGFSPADLDGVDDALDAIEEVCRE